MRADARRHGRSVGAAAVCRHAFDAKDIDAVDFFFMLGETMGIDVFVERGIEGSLTCPFLGMTVPESVELLLTWHDLAMLPY